MSSNDNDKSAQPASPWVHGEPGELAPENRELLERIEDLIRDEARGEVLESIRDWPPADLQELMLYLPIKLARRAYAWLPSELAADVLEEVSPDLRANLLDSADIERIVEITEELDEDDAVELLDDLPDPVVKQLLERLDDSEELRERLEFEEDTAGEAMTG